MSRFRFLLGTVLIVLSVSLLATQNTEALLNRLVGTWREDASQRRLGDVPPTRFRRSAAGGLEELTGSEAKPAVLETMEFHKPFKNAAGDQVTWRQIDKSTFERTAESTRGTVVRRLSVSADGKTLFETIENKLPNGRNVVTNITHTRLVSDSHPLVGSWKRESFTSTGSPNLTFERVGANGFRVISGLGGITNVTLDGTPTPLRTAGQMIAVKALDDYTLEETITHDAALVQRITRTVSPDGKTMTVIGTSSQSNATPTSSVWIKD